jgi:hypothetical protein
VNDCAVVRTGVPTVVPPPPPPPPPKLLFIVTVAFPICASPIPTQLTVIVRLSHTMLLPVVIRREPSYTVIFISLLCRIVIGGFNVSESVGDVVERRSDVFVARLFALSLIRVEKDPVVIFTPDPLVRVRRPPVP